MMMNIWTSITSIASGSSVPIILSFGTHLKVPSSCQSCTVPSMEPSTKRCQVWLDRWCLRCPFGISIHNTFDVTLIHQNVYIRKKNKLGFLSNTLSTMENGQIYTSAWSEYVRIPNQSVIIDVLSSRWDTSRCKDSLRACLTPAPE